MGTGALAERIAVPGGLLGPLPDGLDWAQGAALPVSALTARLLVQAASVPEGGLVLVTGAAGMVGGMAVQLAQAAGARVVAAVRDSDAAQARSLGAEATVNTGDELAAELRRGWPQGFDACLDTLGLQGAVAGVRDGGAYVTTQPDRVPAAERASRPRRSRSSPTPTRSGRSPGRPLPGTSRSGSRPPFRWRSSAAAMTWWPEAVSAARSWS